MSDRMPAKCLCLFACVASALTPGAALSQQSYAESMADCSALYLTLGNNVSKPDNIERMEFATRAWALAAVTNGLSQSEVIDRVRETAAGWSTEPFVFTDELKDWAEYCRAFAREVGVDYDPAD